MKTIALALLLLSATSAALCATAVSAQHAAAPRATRVDDPPPPEPIDCPLCSGNVKLHGVALRNAARLAMVETALGMQLR